jgi:hypothetical protein
VDRPRLESFSKEIERDFLKKKKKTNSKYIQNSLSLSHTQLKVEHSKTRISLYLKSACHGDQTKSDRISLSPHTSLLCSVGIDKAKVGFLLSGFHANTIQATCNNIKSNLYYNLKAEAERKVFNLSKACHIRFPLPIKFHFIAISLHLYPFFFFFPQYPLHVFIYFLFFLLLFFLSPPTAHLLLHVFFFFPNKFSLFSFLNPFSLSLSLHQSQLSSLR